MSSNENKLNKWVQNITDSVCTTFECFLEICFRHYLDIIWIFWVVLAVLTLANAAMCIVKTYSNNIWNRKFGLFFNICLEYFVVYYSNIWAVVFSPLLMLTVHCEEKTLFRKYLKIAYLKFFEYLLWIFCYISFKYLAVLTLANAGDALWKENLEEEFSRKGCQPAKTNQGQNLTLYLFILSSFAASFGL